MNTALDEMNPNDLLVFAQSYDWDHHDGGWVVMGLGMLVFWALVIGLVVWLVRTWEPTHRAAGAPPEPPLDVLDRRLADGGISVDEYKERRRFLTGRGTRGGDAA